MSTSQAIIIIEFIQSTAIFIITIVGLEIAVAVLILYDKIARINK